MVITPLLTHAGARGGHEVLGAAVAADPAGGVLGFILPGCEDDGATRLLGVWEGVAILLELALREQVLLEAAVQGGPFRSSTRGLLGRLSEKLVLAANLPPSTTSWDTTLRPLVSGRG